LGCTALLTIILTEPDDLAMPTGFTPNGDGHNDVFFIQGLDAYPQNQLVIINRWGNVVYERPNYRNDWRGENMQGGELPNGTYFAILRVGHGEGERNLQNYVDLRR
jgi:gliding motility-associated-like protein